jgi:hypothetical protein
MTLEDTKRIEQALGITLPKHYVSIVTRFPIPAWAGNSETSFWDDADALIGLNLELREKEGAREPWPDTFFALGRDAGGCSDALDLISPSYLVFWADRGYLTDVLTIPSKETIEQWILRQTKDMTSDLIADGLDPNSHPEIRRQQQDAEAKSGFGSCIFLILIAAALIALGIYIGRR